MPCLTIFTNIPRSKIPTGFEDRIIPVLSGSMKRPKEQFICAISGDAKLHMFGDSTNPGVVATLESFGSLGPKENEIISRQLADFMQVELGVIPGRFFLSFYELQDYNIGIKGTTVPNL